MSVVDQLPSPRITSASSQVIASNSGRTITYAKSYNFPSGTSAGSATITPGGAVYIPYCVTGPMLAPGEVVYMYVPELWNPHDANASTANSATTNSLRPTQFRFYAQTANPAGVGQWKIGVESQINTLGTPTGDISLQAANSGSPTLYYWPISQLAQLTQASTTLQFSDNSGQLFREPTLPWNSQIPDLNPVAIPGNTSVHEATTGKTYCGIVVAKAPVSMQISVQTTPFSKPGDGNYVVQCTTIDTLADLTISPTATRQITFTLQCQDSMGNWIPYDTEYPNMDHQVAVTNIVANTADYSKDEWQNPLSMMAS